ncbi:MAG: hypothetical protein ABJG68_12060 [Crocinitomicaceae bacterium]
MNDENPYLAYCKKMHERGDSFRIILSHLKNKGASESQIEEVMNALSGTDPEVIAQKERKLAREKAKENMTEEELKKQQRLEKAERDFLSELEKAEPAKKRTEVPGADKKAWKVGVLTFLGSIVIFSFLAHNMGESAYGIFGVLYGLLVGLMIRSIVKSRTHKIGVISAIVSGLGAVYIIPLTSLAAFHSWSHYTEGYAGFWGFMVQGNFLEWMMYNISLFSVIAILGAAYAGYKVVVGKKVRAI